MIVPNAFIDIYIYTYIYIYIKYLDGDITSKVLTFADDTSVQKIKSAADTQHLQDDFNKLTEVAKGV